MFGSNKTLADLLGSMFGFRTSRSETLSWLIWLIMQYGSVCMYRLAAHVPSEAKIESIRQRIRRFFVSITLTDIAVAKFIVSFLCLGEKRNPWILQIDRTNWEYGKTIHNLLVLSVLWQGVAIPLFWTNLEKDGNSNTKERTDLLQKLIDAFPDQPIGLLTGDREFVGKKWLAWLAANNIPFSLRHKGNMYAFQTGMAPVLFSWMARNLKPGETLNLKGGWHVGQDIKDASPPVFVAIKRLKDGTLLIIASSFSAKKAMAAYKTRWKIETLFGLLKTKGFNLEDTHMTDPKRLATLFAILAIAAAIAIKIGRIVLKKMPIKIKKHGRPARSIFALGLDVLRKFTSMTNWQKITAAFKQILQPNDLHNTLMQLGFLR
jgi:hypothetical protein